ncbi:MAG: hypothetical protein LBM08_03875 [Dysgonamonadaceae bacterium]|jgi:hypothetical protein|nr:hypothetical protein [Dysgonamonadaceae bacterium]
MDVYGQIAERLKNIAGQGQNIGLFIAEVINISGDTCDVSIDDLTLTDVRLRAVINDESGRLFIKPKVGSYVIVADLSGEYLREPVVISYSEIDAVNIKIESTTVDIDKDGIILNGGRLKGLVAVDAMVGWMQQVYTDLQMLKTQLSVHPVAGNGAPLAMIFNPSTASPQSSHFTNEKIKQ